MALIGYIEQLHCVGLVRKLILISRMEMRFRAPVTRGYFFLLGALHLVNAASPRNIDQKKYPLEPGLLVYCETFCECF